MAYNSNVRFLVKKETVQFRQCSFCSGSGRKKRQFQGRKFDEPCPTCKGTGKEKFIHSTEVSLIEALKELNLINHAKG